MTFNPHAERETPGPPEGPGPLGATGPRDTGDTSGDAPTWVVVADPAGHYRGEPESGSFLSVDAATPSSTQVRWFGQSWGAYICQPHARVTVPVGSGCQGCTALIEDYDSGVSVRPADAGGLWSAHHLECFMRQIAAQVSAEVLDGTEPRD